MPAQTAIRDGNGAHSWVGRVLRPLSSRTSGRRAIATDPLLAFASEDESKTPPPSDSEPPQLRTSRAGSRVGVTLAAAVLLTAAATFALTRMVLRRDVRSAAQTGTVTVVTRPAGAHVTIDGNARGVTPLTISLSPGAHTLGVRHGDEERVVPVTVTAGGDIVRDLEMNRAAPAALFGGVSIATDPSGARVTVDGQPSGTSPVTLEELAVGEHTIAVASATGSAEKKVTVTAGQTASVLFSLPKVSGPVGGWLSVSAPFDIQVMEGADVIGAGSASKIMLAAGRHDIVLVNRTLEFQESRRLEIVPGQTTLVGIDAPTVPMNVNARPWAEVTLDGESLGETPISNATVPIGTHQLAFRHPQLGERRQTVVVTAKGPNRVSVDLTK
jgi:PEGA domain